MERKAEILEEEGFRNYCLQRKLSEKTIQAHVKIVKEFETFLKTKCHNRSITNATSANLHAFVKHLMEENRNTWDNLLPLVRYARFINNKEIIVPLLELLDGSDVLESLSNTIKQTVGKTKHKAIFEGIKLPPLGTLPKYKPKITKKFMDSLEAELGVSKCREILSSGPHAGPKEQYLPEQKKFLESKSIDDFLTKKHKEYVEELEKHMKEKTLYFTQEITKEVLDYVRKTPTCQVGVREGDIIYVTKIPYMAKEYLREKNPKKKRYYACHCAWVREAIKSDLTISPDFCYCSAGFEKRLWDVIFGQNVKADVVGSVLKGDLVCEFAIHIPKEYPGKR
ncbi:MAG: site-specific integrase [Candidatus Bathyarchaeia archaeon]